MQYIDNKDRYGQARYRFGIPGSCTFKCYEQIFEKCFYSRRNSSFCFWFGLRRYMDVQSGFGAHTTADFWCLKNQWSTSAFWRRTMNKTNGNPLCRRPKLGRLYIFNFWYALAVVHCCTYSRILSVVLHIFEFAHIWKFGRLCCTYLKMRFVLLYILEDSVCFVAYTRESCRCCCTYLKIICKWPRKIDVFII